MRLFDRPSSTILPLADQLSALGRVVDGARKVQAEFTRVDHVADAIVKSENVIPVDFWTGEKIDKAIIAEIPLAASQLAVRVSYEDAAPKENSAS